MGIEEMRLVDDTKMPVSQDVTNGVNGNHDGNNGHHEYESESESEIEDAEPVSATLVLRVVSEPPSPSVSRKSSFRRDQPPSFLQDEPPSHARSEQFLQVQVQRSTSSSSLSGSRSQSRSRPVSAAPSFCITDTEPSYNSFNNFNGHDALERYKKQSVASSRESSMSPTPSMYGVSDMSLSQSQSSLNSNEFMQKISEQTKMIQQGMRTLRGEMDNQMRLLDLGQEAVVLSGLQKQTSSSLKNIKNLYDETKYLKTYLEKLEAKVHYDMSVTHKNPQSPPWYRRLLFLGGILGTGAWIWSRQDPSGFERSVEKMSQQSLIMWGSCVDFLTNKAGSNNLAVTLK